MRVCHCVGHLTNPGGVCCHDLPSASPAVTVTGTGIARPLPLDEERIREIIREELAKAKRP